MTNIIFGFSIASCFNCCLGDAGCTLLGVLQVVCPPSINGKSRTLFDSPEESHGGRWVLVNRQEHWSLPGREHLDSGWDVSEASPGLTGREKMVRWQPGDHDTQVFSPRHGKWSPSLNTYLLSIYHILGAGDIVVRTATASVLQELIV